jgi:hypothetical protein
MGNGNIILRNRFAQSMDEVIEAPVVFNTGAFGGSPPAGDTSKYLFAVVSHEDSIIFGMRQNFSFASYRVSGYYADQVDIKRPELTISQNIDSTVTLSIDSTEWANIMWIDGEESGSFSRTITIEEFESPETELVAYVTNDPEEGFWLATNRYLFKELRPLSALNSPLLYSKIYPNPVASNGILAIESESDLAEVYICSLTGQLMLTQQATGKTANVEIPGLAAGTYFLVSAGKNGQISRSKIVIYE